MVLSKYIINYICLKKIINVVYKHLLNSVKVDMFTKLLIKFMCLFGIYKCHYK